MARRSRIDTCRLCGNESRLCKSHILPRLAFRLSRQESGSVVSVLLDVTNQKEIRYTGLGWKEELLCSSCERKLSRVEDRIAKILRGRHPVTIKAGSTINVDEVGNAAGGGSVILQGLPYREWRLFGLSMLWRAAVSQIRPFQDVDLAEHELSLREAIRKGDPVPRTFFPFFNYLVVLDNKICKGIVTGPRDTKWDGMPAYELILGGVGWIFLIGDQLWNPLIEHGTIDPQGDALFLVSHAVNDIVWLRRAFIEAATGKALPLLPDPSVSP